jgi:hypothetical protein
MWPDTGEPPSLVKSLLLSKNSVNPGNAHRTLLRLNDDVVSLLEAIEVILVHRDVLKAPAVPPGGDNQAAAARERASGNLSDDGCGNANGA